MKLYQFFRSVAFKLDPELIHEFSLHSFKMAPYLAEIFPHVEINPEKYSVKVGTLNWSFPVGLAAGLDKNAVAIDFFTRLGFGAIEVGTVTPKAQPGNPRPRLFRYPNKKTLRNMMGFNNQGAKIVLSHLKESSRSQVIGVNLGKNKDTPLHLVASDYQILYQQFAGIADYLVINVSSPNTPGLRDLQKKEELEKIFSGLVEDRKKVSCPLYIKISPDLNMEDVDDVIELSIRYKLDGIIATNTTLMPEIGPGGISGKMLYERSKRIRDYVLEHTKKTNLEVIGVGGISNFEHLLEFWEKGGKVVQIYTSFIFEGPEVLLRISKDIDKYLKKIKVSNVQEALKKINN